MIGAHVRWWSLGRSLAAASCAVLALGPSGGLAQPPPAPSVSDLVVRPAPMVPVPDVGEGAPLLSLPEIRAIETQARMDVMGAARDMRGCLNRLPMGSR